MSAGEMAAFLALLAIALLLTARYALWWFRADHIPTNYSGGESWATALANYIPFFALTWLEALRVLQMGTLWAFALLMRRADMPSPPPGLRVAVLTTIVPSKEPIAMLEETLKAMLRIRYGDGIHVWVLDEEDSPKVRALCSRLGVFHFSRHGIEAYNQPSGPFRARTKAGNHNAWRDGHGAGYDVVAQMDPDHVPTEDFLEKTLGYFRDPNVAYVIAPQVYYRNTDTSWIARGADEQNFGFSAITQRGANALGMPIFIGSNHVCRTRALDSVGGYASHIVEDHLTGMLLLTTRNPKTGEPWKGVYTDAIISYGEGPSRWSSYLSQQLRWSYGLVDIVQRYSPRLLWRMRPAQAFGFTLIQSYYGSVAIILLTGLSLTAGHLFFGIDAVSVDFREWLSYWFPQLSISIAIWYWLQRFYLRETDRGWGLRAILVGVGAMVVYAQALVLSVLGRGLSYVITPKGEVGTREPIILFRWHILSMALSAGALAWAVWHSAGAATIKFWAVLNIVQMAIVVGTGVITPHLLTTRLSSKTFDSWSRYPIRVAVPVSAGLVAIVAVSLTSTSYTPAEQPVNANRADGGLPAVIDTPAVAAPDTPSPTQDAQPTPVNPVRANFLEEGSGAVAFGTFELGTHLNIRGKVVHEFIDFAPGSIVRMQQVVAKAASADQVLLLSWEPKFAGLPEESATLVEQIGAGEFDAYIAEVATALRDTRQPVLLRFAPEMDHVTDELHPWSGQNPALYIAAWRRVHKIFQEHAASNVVFTWTPGGYFIDGVFESDAWYPGDDVVDIVGFTAYAYWGWEEWDADRAASHAYRSPEELIRPRYDAILEHGKPVILPEFGVDLYPTQHAEQIDWLVSLVDLIDRDLPDLVAIIYFHAPHSFTDVDIDWELTLEEQRAFEARLKASDRIELGTG